MQRNKEGLDLNRNFPAHWRQEGEQYGAGPFPGSEPEVYNLVKFITSHPNITGGMTFHTFSGVLLRPYGTQADDTMPAEDLWTFQTIGKVGTEMTGYPAISVFHDFKYHPERGHHRRLRRLDVRSSGGLRLDRRDLVAAASGGHHGGLR